MNDDFMTNCGEKCAGYLLQNYGICRWKLKKEKKDMPMPGSNRAPNYQALLAAGFVL
jgi:hypothetical protein